MLTNVEIAVCFMWGLFENPGTKKRNEANISAIKWAQTPEKQAGQLAQHDTPQGEGLKM